MPPKRIVDSHVHLFDLDHHAFYPWLSPRPVPRGMAGDVTPIAFGSNFPVDKLYSSFATLFDAFDAITRGFSESERELLFAGTAEKFYRI